MKTRVSIVVLVVLFSLLVVPVAYAQDIGDPGVDKEIAEYIAAFGLGFLVPFIVQLGKMFLPGLFPDGSGGMWTAILNVLIYFLLLLAGAYGIDLEGDLAQSIISIAASIAALVLMILTSYFSFGKMREAEIGMFKPRDELWRLRK